MGTVPFAPRVAEGSVPTAPRCRSARNAFGSPSLNTVLGQIYAALRGQSGPQPARRLTPPSPNATDAKHPRKRTALLPAPPAQHKPTFVGTTPSPAGRRWARTAP